MNTFRRTITAAAVLTLAATAGVTAASANTPAPTVDRYARNVAPHATIVTSGAERWAGPDRYFTAADIARSAGWDDTNTTVVYLANGTATADALALGPSTTGGPLLLVKADALPDVVIQELDRLRPCYIVGVGGVGVLTDRVIAQAATHTGGDLAKCQQ